MRLVSTSTTSAPPTGGLPEAVQALDSALASLQTHFRGLLTLTNEKLEALRRADTTALHAGTAREAELLNDILAGEKQRDAVLARVAQHLPGSAMSSPRVSAIVDRLPEPAASRIRARNAGLRSTAEELQKKNRLAAGVARNLQSHLRGIFADIAKAQTETVGYGRDGQMEASTTRAWVDAVG